MTFVCLRAALADVMYMSVSFGFVSLISFSVTTVLLREEKKEGKQHIKKKRTFGLKKKMKKMKKKKKRLKDVIIFNRITTKVLL